MEGREGLKGSKGSISKSKSTPLTPPLTSSMSDHTEAQLLLFSTRQKSRWATHILGNCTGYWAACQAPADSLTNSPSKAPPRSGSVSPFTDKPGHSSKVTPVWFTMEQELRLTP